MIITAVSICCRAIGYEKKEDESGRKRDVYFSHVPGYSSGRATKRNLRLYFRTKAGLPVVRGIISI